MSTHRIGNKWTVNEVLSLQREFELLGWDIVQIAEKHGRTANAIMFKLDQEGFADYNVLYSNYHNLNAKMPVGRTQKQLVLETFLSDDDDTVDDDGEEDDDDTVVDDEHDEDYVDDDGEEDDDDNIDDEDPLTERVAKLESGLDEIRNILKQMVINTKTQCGIDN